MANWEQVRVIKKQRWNKDLFSLHLDVRLAPFKAGQFIKVGLDIGNERVERPYSLVNCPAEQGAEILFNVVDEGPLTPTLAGLEEGDMVWATRDAHGFLILEEVPRVSSLWMVATGTGIGPFISMLRSNASELFEKIMLVHGVRHEADLAYRDEIEKMVRTHAGRLVYIPVISRQTPANMLHGRITQRLADGSLEIHAVEQINAENTHLLLCGNIDMIRDVQELLGERGLKKHRRFDTGHISMEKYH